jgi:hypothetical protein
MRLAAGESALERVPVHVGKREDLARGPVLDHTRHEALVVERDRVDH